MNLEQYKKQAAEKAVESVVSGMVVGLGTGSTAVYATRKIGQLLASGELTDIVAVPTSEQTAEQARESGVPLTTLTAHPAIDLTIDGADEIAPDLNLIKGLGGALLREKIVAQASKQMIVISDYHKIVNQLGERAPVPVEVVPFAVRTVETFLHTLNANPVLRLKKGTEEPFITDEGNVILDCHIGVMANPVILGQAIVQYPGVVEHGLFINLATKAVVAGPDGVDVLIRP